MVPARIFCAPFFLLLQNDKSLMAKSSTTIFLPLFCSLLWNYLYNAFLYIYWCHMFAHVSCFYHVLAILFLFLPLFLLTRRSIYFHVLSLTYTAKSYSHQFNRFICTTFRCALCSQDNIYKLLPTFCDHAVRAWFFIIIPACFLIFSLTFICLIVCYMLKESWLVVLAIVFLKDRQFR